MYDTGVLLPETLAPSTAWLAVALNTACIVTAITPEKCTVFHSLRIASATIISVSAVTLLELLHDSTSPGGLPGIFIVTEATVDNSVNERHSMDDAWHAWAYVVGVGVASWTTTNAFEKI